jgi:DNA polymerase/3'-5' exonuclease PolX
MSNAPKLPYVRMLPIAQGIVNRLAANCKRIEIAGSIRRQKNMIGDIEIVAVPTEALYAQLDELLASGKIGHKPRKAWGNKLCSFVFDTKAGDPIQVDLFLQPDPATWGVNFMIRTGSSEFSHHMVTRRDMGGWMPNCFQVEGALVWWNEKVIPTLEEKDVFALWGMDYVQPEHRTENYNPAVLRETTLDFTLADVREFAQAHAPRFTFADAERLTAESATWPLPVFPGGPGQAARDAIERSERERMRIQGVRG